MKFIGQYFSEFTNITLGLFLALPTAVNAEVKHGSHAPRLESRQLSSTHTAKSESVFSTTIPAKASFVKKSKELLVKDGDHITITATIVKQKMGNKIIKRLAYNGMIPGPMIKAPEGATIKVKLVNLTDTETTLHSHGLRLDYKFDGVPGVDQAPIKPGESFEYTLKFPDAGLYWYHPHIREDYAQEMGLYGTYYVTPKDKNFYNPVDREQNLVVDDINLDSSGKMPAFSTKDTNYALMGRFGNRLLVNDDPNYELTVKRGDVVRFFVTNVANTRTFRLRALGIKMKRVGGDMGLYEKEQMVDEIILAPAERAIVEAYFPEKGQFEIQHVGAGSPVKLFSVRVGEGIPSGKYLKEFSNLRDIAAVKAEMTSVRRLEKAPPVHTVTLSVDLPPTLVEHMKAMNHDKAEPIEWDDPMEAMNADALSSGIKWNIIDKDTGKTNMAINWTFKKGDLVKIRIFNDPNSAHPMQHPIHFHGQRFAVLTEDGVANQNMVWKDTVLVKTGSTVDIVLEASNPGEWMGHCHISEHLSSGMMFGFKVVD